MLAGACQNVRWGERCKVPGTEFDVDSGDEEEHPEWLHAVVTDVMKTCTQMWFKDDDELKKCGAIGSWMPGGSTYTALAMLPLGRRQSIKTLKLQRRRSIKTLKLQIAAKLHRAPRAVVSRLGPDPGNNRGASSSDSDEDPDTGDDDEDAAGGEEEGPSQVDAWESDPEDDECELGPEVDADEADGNKPRFSARKGPVDRHRHHADGSPRVNGLNAGGHCSGVPHAALPG
jgi:hypothetical protein